MYTIRDRLAEAGGSPFISRNHLTAARVYTDFLSKNMNINYEEFELIYIGKWEEEKCKLTALDDIQKVDVKLPPSVTGREV